MTPSTVHTELPKYIHANLRDSSDHTASAHSIENHIRAGSAQPESGPYIEDESMLPHRDLPGWPPMQPLDYGTHTQENPQPWEASRLPDHIDYPQPSDKGATTLPLNPSASTANSSHNTDFHDSPTSMADFAGLTCHCLCHHHALEPCFCFPDCSFYRASPDALLE